MPLSPCPADPQPGLVVEDRLRRDVTGHLHECLEALLGLPVEAFRAPAMIIQKVVIAIKFPSSAAIEVRTDGVTYKTVWRPSCHATLT